MAHKDHDDNITNRSSDSNVPQADPVPESDGKKVRKHWIRTTWLRRTLKTLFWVLLFVLILPFSIYIPPVQDCLVKVAEKVVHDKTGMTVGIGKFRLKFPLDVNLKDVYVVEASGDTMVRAKEAIVDLKVLPLLALDIEPKKLQLSDGYYRMLAADSSLLLKVSAGFLELDDKASVDIAESKIDLNKVLIRQGRLSLFMDVWKKKPSPQDTVSSDSKPFRILANDIELQDFQFGMSMLPTIDTLSADVDKIRILEASVDLGENTVQWGLAELSDGSFEYLAPTEQYVKTHPAPPSEPSTGPPMRIMGDSIAISGLSAKYGIVGAKPQPGFDPSCLVFTDVNIGMHDFYNESSTVLLPITGLSARERCGLQVVSGHGNVEIDSVGLKLRDLSVKTPYSAINATADLPFAAMSLDPNSAMSVDADGRIGIPDVEAFMPSLKTMLAAVPARKPLDFTLDAAGSISNLRISNLKAAMPGVVSLKASGYARNALDYKKLRAHLLFDGTLSDPTLADKIVGQPGLSLPAFTIAGTADANGLDYAADFTLRSTAGDVDAVGRVALTPENYSANVETVGLDLGRFLPDLGIGRVTASIRANGHGFNPLSGSAVTDAIVNIHSIEYKHNTLRDIHLAANLTSHGNLVLTASSPNPALDFDLHGAGTIHKDDYTFDVHALLRDVDLRRLGLTADSVCYGSGTIDLVGSARPGKWLYDVNLQARAVEWHLNDQYYHIPDSLTASLKADLLGTSAYVSSDLTYLDFNSPASLHKIVDDFSKVAELAGKQVRLRNVDIEELSNDLPQFTLELDASGRGLLSQILEPQGISVDTVTGVIAKDSVIHGNIEILEFANSSVKVDTLTLNIKERGQMLDYKLHMGNRPGTLDEFASVNLNGYLGNNRLSAFLNQYNIKGEQGYRIGTTVAFTDSVISAHITPLKSTIAYLPWTFNSDNFLDFNLRNKHIEANLQASSAESSILARTQKSANGQDELYVKIDNLHIQDFLSMWAMAPDMKGDLDVDMHVSYEDKRFKGNGDITLDNFIYQKTRVGNFDLGIDASYGLDSSTDVLATLKVNGDSAIAAYAKLVPGPDGMRPDTLGIELTRFPLKVANPFLGNAVTLSGYLNGDMGLEGSFSEPLLNGAIAFDSVTAHIPAAGATLSFVSDKIDIDHNVLEFPNFKIYGANDNPLTLNGTVDATKFSNITFDLEARADNFQLIKSDKRSKDDLYGKVFLTLGATVKGPMRMMNVNADVNVLGNTDCCYRLNMEPAQLSANSDQDVVKFVNFADSTLMAKADSVPESPLHMRINANARISSGAHIEVQLSSSGNDRVELDPTANLKYFQNYMGDMTLTGTLTLGDGYAQYNVPVVGEKKFVFDPASTITWNGEVTNPTLNITATDDVKASVTTDNNSRLVNFLVTAKITNTLRNLQVAFNLSTNDDMTVQNELQSMSADQRQTQAMNLLLYGQYLGQNTKSSAASGNMLYSFLESQINNWAANNIRGVDLSFGVNQYDKTTDGVTSTETTYSYQVSKSLFSNRFKILVGGNYSTDSEDEDIANNLVSDVALEYVLRQTQNTNMSVRLFRHIGYESILEGEITEMGVGFVVKRKLNNFRSLFHFGHRRKKLMSLPADTAVRASRDSIHPATSDTSDSGSNGSDSPSDTLSLPQSAVVIPQDSQKSATNKPKAND